MSHTLASSRLLFFVLILFCVSCGKEKIDLPWEEQISNINSQLNSVYFNDVNSGYAVGGDTWSQGYSLHTDDGGDNWSVDSLANKKMYAVNFNSSGIGVAVGIDGYYYRKETPQDDWTFYRLPRWDILRDVSYNASNVGILVGGAAFQNGTIMRLDGTSLTQRDTFDHELGAVCFSDEETVHAGGYGIMLRSDDTGITWTRLSVEGDFFRAIHFPSSNIGYAVGSGGTIMKTADAGLKWKKLREGEKLGVKDIPFRDVYFVDDDKGYIVGEGGVFWRTINGGDDWQEVKGMPDTDFLSVHVVDGHGYIVGEKGRIFHFED